MSRLNFYSARVSNMRNKLNGSLIHLTLIMWTGHLNKSLRRPTYVCGLLGGSCKFMRPRKHVCFNCNNDGEFWGVYAQESVMNQTRTKVHTDMIKRDTKNAYFKKIVS